MGFEAATAAFFLTLACGDFVFCAVSAPLSRPPPSLPSLPPSHTHTHQPACFQIDITQIDITQGWHHTDWRRTDLYHTGLASHRLASGSYCVALRQSDVRPGVVWLGYGAWTTDMPESQKSAKRLEDDISMLIYIMEEYTYELKHISSDSCLGAANRSAENHKNTHTHTGAQPCTHECIIHHHTHNAHTHKTHPPSPLYHSHTSSSLMVALRVCLRTNWEKQPRPSCNRTSCAQSIYHLIRKACSNKVLILP